jgi:hypothetical protein
MKKITNPIEHTRNHHSEQGGNHKVEKLVIKSTDINDQVVDDRVEIKAGKSIVASERVAENMKRKYPWLIVEDYVPEKTEITKKDVKKSIKKRKKRK